MSYETIVTGTDLSTGANQGILAALDVARTLGSRRLHVVHVVPVSWIADFLVRLGGSAAQGRQERLRDTAVQKLHEFRVADERLSVTREVRVGVVARELAGAAASIGAGLIVLAKHSPREPATIFSRSVARAIIQVAPCPVLILGEGGSTEVLFRNVLAALDLSPLAQTVLQHAVAMARANRGAVHAYSVAQPAPAFPPESSFLFSVPQEVEPGQIVRESKSRVEQIVEGVPHEGVSVDVEMAVGSAVANSILSAARRARPDLLVVGSKSHGPGQQTGLGSTAKRVASKAACPVLVVPAA